MKTSRKAKGSGGPHVDHAHNRAEARTLSISVDGVIVGGEIPVHKHALGLLHEAFIIHCANRAHRGSRHLAARPLAPAIGHGGFAEVVFLGVLLIRVAIWHLLRASVPLEFFPKNMLG